MNFNITFEPNISNEDEKTIYEGLLSYNSKDLGLPIEEIGTKRFAFVVRSDGVIKAGLVGSIKYTSAFIDTLWVSEAIRKQGIGQSLLKSAEEYAIKNACQVIFLNTLSLANVSFYKKSGYFLEFERSNYLANFSMKYFRKNLK